MMTNIFSSKIDLSKLFTFLIILLPILDQYRFWKLETMDSIAIVCVLVSIIICKRIIINKGLIVFLVFLLVSTFINSYFIEPFNFIGLILKLSRILVLYYVFYVLSENSFNLEFGYKIYTKFVFVVSSIIFFQFVIYHIWGIGFGFLIPGLNLNYGDCNSNELMRLWAKQAAIRYFRPCGVFLEPAIHAQYVLPWLALAIFNLKNFKDKAKIMQICFIAITAFMTTSSFAIMGIFLLLFFYIVKEVFKGKKEGVYCVVLGLPLVFLCLSDVNIQTQLLWKKESLSKLEEGRSLTLRLIRGILIFNEFDNTHKLFGCGFGNLRSFIISNNIPDFGGDRNKAGFLYMNSFSFIACNLGIIGFLIFSSFLIIMYSKSKVAGKQGLIIVLFLYGIASCIFDSPTYFLVIAFLSGKSNPLLNDIYRFENMSKPRKILL